MTHTANTVYCFDTSAFIYAGQNFRISVFPRIWIGFESLIKEGRLVVPKEVKNEIFQGNKDDFLFVWFKKNTECVVDYTEKQLGNVHKIVNKYPRVSDYKNIRAHHADPMVVALAMETGATVVTNEVRNESEINPKIPNLCDEFGVNCVDIFELMELEGWIFS